MHICYCSFNVFKYRVLKVWKRNLSSQQSARHYISPVKILCFLSGIHSKYLPKPWIFINVIYNFYITLYITDNSRVLCDSELRWFQNNMKRTSKCLQLQVFFFYVREVFLRHCFDVSARRLTPRVWNFDYKSTSWVSWSSQQSDTEPGLLSGSLWIRRGRARLGVSSSQAYSEAALVFTWLHCKSLPNFKAATGE